MISTKMHHSVIFQESCSIMDSFAELMCTFGVSQPGLDLIAALPVEISEMILRKLDPPSLLNAVQVSRKWMNICKRSSPLKKTCRQYLRKQKRRAIQCDLALVKQSKKQTLLRTMRMQTDMTRRISQQGAIAPPVFTSSGLIKPNILNIQSKDKKPISRASPISTRSFLKLR